MKAVAQFIQTHFRGRLYKGYVINAPKAFNLIFKVISVFVDERTLKKISITSDKSNPEMLTHISKDQLERRFGGNLNVPEVYWPPQFKSLNFFLEGEKEEEILISKEEYLEKFENGELEGYRVAPWVEEVKG